MKLSYRDMKKLEKQIIDNPDVLGTLLNNQITSIDREIILDAIGKIREKRNVFSTFLSFLECVKSGLITYVFMLITFVAILVFSFTVLAMEIRVNDGLKKIDHLIIKSNGLKSSQSTIKKDIDYLNIITKPLIPLSDEGN